MPETIEKFLRKFRHSDAQKIEALTIAFYREYTEGEPMSSEKIHRTLQELSLHPEKGCVFVFEKENEIVGYAIVINYWSNEYGGNIIILDELYVAPDYRNRGIGTSFINYLIKNRLNSSVAIQLEVEPSNHKAKKLYERMGFKPAKNLHMFYKL